MHGWTIGLHSTMLIEQAWVITENDVASVVNGIVVDMVNMYRIGELGEDAHALAPGMDKFICARHPGDVEREEVRYCELMPRSSVGVTNGIRPVVMDSSQLQRPETARLTEK